MEKFDKNKASEMLTQLMDNELGSADKKKILEQIKNNEDLQQEHNAHQKIREAIQEDEESSKPPIAATAAVFGAVGMSYPVEATGTGVLISAFLKKNWMPISVALLALASSIFFLFDSEESDPQIAGSDSEIVKGNNDNTIVSNSNSATKEINSENGTETGTVKSNANNVSNQFSNQIKNNSKASGINNTPSNGNLNSSLGSNKSNSNSTFASNSSSKSNNNLSSNLDVNSNGLSLLNSNSKPDQNDEFNSILTSNKDNLISGLFDIFNSELDQYQSNNDFAKLSFYNVPYKKRTYFTDVHKESIFNLGLSGFSNQENQNNGLGAGISLNISRLSPEVSGVVSQLRFNLLTENITKLDGTGGFGNSRLSLSARLNPEMQIINLLNTDIGRPIIEIGVGNFEGVTPVFSAGYEIRIISKTVLEIKYTQFGAGMIGVGFSKGF